MKRFLKPLLVVVLVAAAIGFVFWRNGLTDVVHGAASEEPAPAAAPAARPTATVAPETPVVAPEPTVAPEEAKPVAAVATPATEETLTQDIQKLLEGSVVAGRLLANEFSRRALLWVVNSSSEHMKADFWPLTPPASELKLKCENNICAYGKKEQARYQPYVDAFRALDIDAVVAGYQRYSSLFEKANADLGEGGSFRKRLLQDLDLAASAPKANDTLQLRPALHGITYAFADEKLEALPYVQKVMIRLSSEQRKVVQEKLAALRTKIAALPK